MGDTAMNTDSAMKLVALFSRLALAAFAVFVLSVALDMQPLALFAFAITSLVLLVVAGDYAPRTAVPRARPASLLPFAPIPALHETTDKLAA